MTGAEPRPGTAGRPSPLALAVTLTLIVGGAVLLVVGWAGDSLGVIYASVVCSALAGVAVIVLGRLSRHRAAVVARAGAAGGLPGPSVGTAGTAGPGSSDGPDRLPPPAGER